MDLHLAILSVVLLSLSFFAAPSAGCEWYNLKDFTLPAFKDKSVSDFLLSAQLVTEKLWICTVKCRFDTRCISYQFNNLTNTCSLFGCGFSQPEKTFLQITEDPGWQLYRMAERNHSFGHVCSTSDDCGYENSLCRDGRCECVLGYSYEPNTRICVTQCAVYGNAFQVQPDYGIRDENNDLFSGMTLEHCMQACLDMSSYVCRSVDFKPGEGQCNLSDKAWMDVPPGSQFPNSGWLFITRHCAVK